MEMVKIFIMSTHTYVIVDLNLLVKLYYIFSFHPASDYQLSFSSTPNGPISVLESMEDNIPVTITLSRSDGESVRLDQQVVVALDTAGFPASVSGKNIYTCELYFFNELVHLQLRTKTFLYPTFSLVCHLGPVTHVAPVSMSTCTLLNYL